MLESNPDASWPAGIKVNKQLIQMPLKDNDNLTVVVENTTDEEVTLNARTVLGWLHAVDDIHQLELKPPPTTEPQPQSSQFNNDFPPETQLGVQESEGWDPPVDLDRLCVFVWTINEKTHPDQHPITRIQEILENLGGNSWFTVLGHGKPYHQGFMIVESRACTAFITTWGLYEWVRIPFGLTNAPELFRDTWKNVKES